MRPSSHKVTLVRSFLCLARARKEKFLGECSKWAFHWGMGGESDKHDIIICDMMIKSISRWVGGGAKHKWMVRDAITWHKHESNENKNVEYNGREIVAGGVGEVKNCNCNHPRNDKHRQEGAKCIFSACEIKRERKKFESKFGGMSVSFLSKNI